MEISELLDQAKDRANLPSDYALAKVLGIATGNLSNIRKGRTHPSNEEAVKLATLAGLDEMRVIAEIELRTANNDKKREFWKDYIESRGIAATLGLIALGTSLVLTPEPAEAGILQLQNYDELRTPTNQVEYTLCEYRTGGKRLIIKAMLHKILQIIRSFALPATTAAIIQ